MGRKSDPFTQCWAAWQREFKERQVSGMELNIFLSIARYQKPTGSGLYKAFRPRAEIALETGYTETQVSDAVKRLTKKGCLKPIGKAYRGGNAQNYLLMPGCPLDGSQKVGAPNPPNGAKRSAHDAPKVGAQDPPNRKKTGAPAHDGSPSRSMDRGQAELLKMWKETERGRKAEHGS